MPSTELRQNVIAPAERIVLKVGTNAVCAAGGGVNRRAVDDLADQVARVMAKGVSVTLVASGAIGAGLRELGLSERPRTMPMLQACAAVGQGQLMREFHDAFAERDLRVAQVLLTRDDFEDRTRYLNIRNTLGALAGCGALAIVNENDTIAVDEIRFGENDVLAALVAGMVGADVLVLLTSVDGLIKDGEVLDIVEQVDEATLALDDGRRSQLGSGGMSSKLQAAGMVARAGEVTVIANAAEPDVLGRLLAGERIGTVFVPAGRKMPRRKRWIMQATRVTGRVVVDEGAARALVERGKSLLPSGIVAVAGRFPKGATVAVWDTNGRQIARGLTNYSSGQIDSIKGLRSDRIAEKLGDKPYDEVIHRDNMTLT